MIQGTFQRLMGVQINNPALPRLIDYRHQIAEHPNCVGAWRFDRDDLIVADDDGVARILNWKPGGPALVHSSGEKAKRTQSNQLSRVVGSFSAAGGYESEQPWNPMQAYTMAIVMKPEEYASGKRMAVCGDRNISDQTKRACIEAWADNSQNPLIRHLRGAGNVLQTVPDTSRFVWAIGSHAGPSSANQSLQTLGRGVTRATGLSETITGTEHPFSLSGPKSSFSGEIDFIALFNVDLLGGTEPELKQRLEEYLAIRAVA